MPNQGVRHGHSEANRRDSPPSGAPVNSGPALKTAFLGPSVSNTNRPDEPVFATTAAFALALALSGGAQLPKEPDFSGEWVLVSATDAVTEQASALTVTQTLTRTTMRGEPMTPFYSSITIERHFNGRAVSEKRTIGTVGGTVPGIPVGQSSPQGEWTTESVNWQADHLVIKTTRSPQPPDQPGPHSEHEEVWSLDSHGRLLITITDRASGSGATTARLVYERRPVALASPGVCQREGATLAGRSPVLVGKGVQAPVKIHDAKPDYSSVPAAARVKSSIWIGEVLVDDQGAISHVWSLREIQLEPAFPAFNRAIVDAIRQWRFEPAMLGGKAIPICMTVTVGLEVQ